MSAELVENLINTNFRRIKRVMGSLEDPKT